MRQQPMSALLLRIDFLEAKQRQVAQPQDTLQCVLFTAAPGPPPSPRLLTSPFAVALIGISSAQQNTVQKANSTQPAAAAATAQRHT